MEVSNILIVEDEYITALDLKILVGSKGAYSLQIVPSGEEAVRRTSDEKIDLIFIDIQLKGELDGIEAVKQIRRKKDIPVVFVSGNSDLLRSDLLKSLHPAGILHKPIEEEAVTGVLEKVFVD